MFNIRFHGRGGQGMKTASRFLGCAFFLAGFEVQDAPRYGAERRGAPMTAYVRAKEGPIYERGIIREPGLVVVADDSLFTVSAAGVLNGLTGSGVLLAVSHETAQIWRERLNITSPLLVLPLLPAYQTPTLPLISAACAGAAAALTGAIQAEHLQQAIRQELAEHSAELINKNLEAALSAFETMAPHRGLVKPNAPVNARGYRRPDWIEMPLDDAVLASATIRSGQTSVKVRTGLWRTQRPVIDYQRCKHCWWICSSSCPDGVINISADNFPEIDYEHCKGCMVCVAQCPSHAIGAIPEAEAQQQEQQEKQP